MHIFARGKNGILLSRNELRTLRMCVANRIPHLVFELSIEGYCCPSCHNVIDREYSECCVVCGQAFSWYGSSKYAIRVTWRDVVAMEQSERNRGLAVAYSDQMWNDAKRKCRLSDADIAIAKRLGINPSSLIKNIPNKSEPWKAPVKDWLQAMDEKAREQAEKKAKRKAKAAAIATASVAVDYKVASTASETVSHEPNINTASSINDERCNPP